jgi:hypothetical protein
MKVKEFKKTKKFHRTYKYHSHIKKFRTQQPITIPEATNLNISSNAIIIWLIGVAAAISRRVVDLFWL